MRTLQFAIVFAVTLSLAFSFSPQVFAGNGCSDLHPSSASDTGAPQTPRFVCNDESILTWYIPDDAQFDEPNPGDPNPRVPIEFVPGAGPWVKHLGLDFLDVITNAIVPGYTDELREFLIVAPNSPAWTDWHEVIMNQPAGEEWIFSAVSIITSPPSNVIIQSNPNTNEVWVDYVPPLQPGTTIDIIKTLEYVGPTPITINTIQQFIEVHQYPTVAEPREPVVGGELLPIDSTTLLLAAAQSPAAWLTTMTFAIIGVGAFLITRNPNNIRNIKVILRDYLDRF